MKKCHSIVGLVVTIAIAVCSCTSYKNVPYLQNSNDVDLTEATRLYDARIMPKDQLTINVSYPIDPEAVKMFNLIMQGENMLSNSGTQRFSSQYQMMSYLVDNEGIINFPILGKMKVAGMTKTELEEQIANRIQGEYTKEKPLVTVQMSSYKVTVLGEVNRGGQYVSSTGKLNIFEALAMAGDLTIYGKRECVKLIRENANGEKKIVELNLNDANIINSPYYQLQQNDIVYVTPNKVKAKNSGIGSETSLWFTSTSILVSIASLLYNILRR